MPEQRGPEERLQPALLDRLTDDEPGNRLESREARVFSKRRLRQAVLRDLAWLFNATQLEAGGDLTRTPLVRESVLNFGLPALSGTAASSLDVGDLAKAIREAILNFEPRILASTLHIKTLFEAGHLSTTISNSSTCARPAPSLRSSFPRSPPDSACTVSRSTIRMSSGSSRASGFSPRASS